MRPYQGSLARSASTIDLSSGSAIEHGTRRLELDGGLVEAAEAGQRPGLRLVGVGEVEVIQSSRLDHSHALLGVMEGELAVTEHGVHATHEPRATRRVLRTAAGRPAPVIRRGVRPTQDVVDLVR